MRNIAVKSLNYLDIFWLTGSLLMAVLLSRYYRNYIFTNGIFDAGLAGSGPGFFALFTVFFATRLLYPRSDPELMLGMIFSLYITQELLSVYTDIGTFDWRDLIYFSLAYFVLKCLFIPKIKTRL